MKMRQLIFLGAITFMATIPSARADYGYSLGIEVRQASDFYGPLAPFGYWVEVPRYGWCWYPAYVEQGWRPYTNGHWLWSDDGWYWASEEPWAWATYHYGRWVWDPYYGWLWMPGIEWAPAWVAWREGDGYVGWAPLPPECDFPSGGDVIYAEQIIIAPQYFVFIQHRHFCDLVRPNTVIVNNTTIINKTINITKINRINQTVVNQGPPKDVIEKYNSGKIVKAKIERRIPPSLQEARQQPRENRPAPQIIRGTRGQADKAAVVQPMPVAPRQDQPEPTLRKAEKQNKHEDRQVTVRQMPPPPAAASDSSTVTTDSSSQSDHGNGRSLGHQRQQ